MNGPKLSQFRLGSEQFRAGLLERPCQGFDVVDGDIAFPTLHRANVSPMKIGQFCQLLLTQSQLLASETQVGSKYNPSWF